MGQAGSNVGKVPDLESIDKLASIATTFLQRSKALTKTGMPLLRESAAQQLEALKTGGVGARIPMIQRAVEASKLATANALRGTQEQLAQGNLAGTPFGQNILAGTRMSGEQATSGIPTQIAQSVISSPTSGLDIIRAALGYGGAAAGAQGNVAGLDLRREMFNSEQFAKFMEDVKSTAQSIGGAAGGGGGGFSGGGGAGGGAGASYFQPGEWSA